MQINFIGQGFVSQGQNSIGKILIEGFNNPNFDNFSCFVAFASYSGVSGLSTHILKAKENLASYYNSLSLAFAEICGRSHGGGVLELMPNETERIVLPYKEENKELLPFIDEYLRNHSKIANLLVETNKVILKKHFGFSDKEIKLAESIRLKLSQRRLNRNKKSKSKALN